MLGVNIRETFTNGGNETAKIPKKKDERQQELENDFRQMLLRDVVLPRFLLSDETKRKSTEVRS